MLAGRLWAVGHLPALIALACGALTNLAFAPFGYFPVAFITLAVLFRLWDTVSPWRAAWLGLAFGFGFYSVGVNWIYISVHDFGAALPMLAGAAVLALALIMSVVIALGGFLQAKINPPRTWKFLALIPALWVAGEWARGWLLGGFPWLYVGYSQTDNWLVGWAPLTGVLGVSLAVCVVAGTIALLSQVDWRAWLTGAVTSALIVLVGYIGYHIDWSSEQRAPIEIAVVQGDVTVIEKWDRQYAIHLLDYFVTQSQTQMDADLIVWPEIALPYLDTRLEKIKLWDQLRQHPADFLVGTLEEQTEGQTTNFYNSAYGITRDGIHKYRKHRLVPFGEYTPFKEWLGWLNNLVELPASDMSAYQYPQSPIQLAGQSAAISICYEDAFPNDVRKMLPLATYLVNISEDAWFGDRLAPYQRLQMSRMRAIELARPVIRAANKGISAAIDHRGQVTSKLAQVDGQLLRATIIPTSGSTPFVRFGFVPVLMLCIVLVVASTSRRRRSV